MYKVTKKEDNFTVPPTTLLCAWPLGLIYNCLWPLLILTHVQSPHSWSAKTCSLPGNSGFPNQLQVSDINKNPSSYREVPSKIFGLVFDKTESFPQAWVYIAAVYIQVLHYIASPSYRWSYSFLHHTHHTVQYMLNYWTKNNFSINKPV